MKKFITLMVAIVIGVMAFASPSSTQDSSTSTSTRIPLRYNRESASKQKRMPSYAQYEETVYCWYDGDVLYFEFLDIEACEDCTLIVSSDNETSEYQVSTYDMMAGIEIGMSDQFNVELIIPMVGTFQGIIE